MGVWLIGAELRIHAETEKGDNESVRMAGKGGACEGCGCGL
jgi:hypothetical protein